MSAPSEASPLSGFCPTELTHAVLPLNLIFLERAVGIVSSSDQPARCAPKSFASYYIHVNHVFSDDYTLFCATGRNLFLYFQEFAHSFGRNGGGGTTSSTRREETGHAGACPAHNFNYAPAPFEKLPTASASVLYTSNTVRSLVICRTS